MPSVAALVRAWKGGGELPENQPSHGVGYADLLKNGILLAVRERILG